MAVIHCTFLCISFRGMLHQHEGYVSRLIYMPSNITTYTCLMAYLGFCASHLRVYITRLRWTTLLT